MQLDLEGSMCNECGTVKSIGIARLRIANGAGTLFAPLCRTHALLYRDEGMLGIPKVHDEVIKIWAAHMPPGMVN